MTKKPKKLVADEKRALLHHQVALILGYNELAVRAETLAEKVYFRLARDEITLNLRAIGGDIDVKEDKVVLLLGERAPHMKFYAKDVEAMRQVVAEFDKEKEHAEGESENEDRR